MDEKNILKLKVLDRTEEMLDDLVEEKIKPHFEYANQSNPIYKKMMQFHNSKIGDKFSVKDLFW